MEFNFINQEEESLPVSPTGQYFTSSVISVSVIGVLETEVPIEVDDSQVEALLKDVFLPINPRFSSIMVTDKRGVKQWKKVEVEIKDHMYKPIFPEGKSVEFYDDCFNQYLSKLAMDQLPQSRPLWEIHIIKYPTTNSAGNVVFRLHHALGDGFSLMGALLSCLQRAENPQLPLTFPALMNQNMNTDDDHKGIFKNVTGICNTLSDFGWSLLKSSAIEDGKSPIRSGDDGVEFRPITITTMTFTLDQIKKMKEILQVTVNVRRYKGPEATAKYIHSTLKNTSMTVSNVIGPVERMALANHPIKGLYFMVVGVPQNLTITMVSYMGQLRIAVGTENGLIDPLKYKSCVENAFDIMFKAATAATPPPKNI
ncbi:unnamed protein product [Fraxinus pennsylvanica]|uniref:Diacylglycerol O-acyltransferase n=1 Tax=Fraxinus pennsylvanica TaxID=56036 RepID=A0AAD1YWY6_9LAMI|nr:unnamed protein product [Fraxinus pennsylvanica]